MRLILPLATALSLCWSVPALALSEVEKSAIGHKIWKNECAGTVEGLTSWNAGEEFPSLGIGHFIWYPAGRRGPFTESWPLFTGFARSHGAELPAVARQTSCPWRSRAEFRAACGQPPLQDLRHWLATHVQLQTDFIVAHSQAALPKLLDAARPADRATLAQRYHGVATTAQGTYALIDYVNFKGEGVNPSERYEGRGWGLLQVLAEMHGTPTGAAAAREFSAAAKRVLERRIANSPAARGEARWHDGWLNRCDTYAKPL